MPGRIFALGAAVCGALTLAVALAPGAASAATTPSRYYLALGDSLSQGVQPDASGASLETNEGYPDQLFATLHRRMPSLKLVKLGCPGESTGSMISGHGNKFAAKSHCDLKGGSQLKAAELFLKAHHNRGEVPLITIDIGANDIDGCASVPFAQIPACVSNGEAAISHDTPLILKAIKKAAPAGAKFAGMTLYDSTLGNFLSPDPALHTLAVVSVPLLKQINADITTADQGAGFLTADVAGAFDSYDTTDMVSWNGQMIPVDVARVCAWTWNCTTPPSGPNIHANKNGYAVIAGAFEKVVGRLH